MAQTINTNIASLTAQRNLASSQKEAATAMQRLSSGLRINSAKDDAAGLSVASKLSAQISGINQAIRNGNDGISVVQIAEGALQETSDLLLRMRDLAVQSANATLTSSERTSLNNEVTQLRDEMDRIATTTSFGDAKLLNGSFQSKSFQVGANVGETLDVNIGSAKTTALGQNFNVTGLMGNLNTAVAATTNSVAAQNLVFQVGTETTTVGVLEDASAKTISASISSEVSGLQASASTSVTVVFDDATQSTDTDMTVTINGQTFDVDMTSKNSVALKGAALKSAIESNAVLAGSLTVVDDGAGSLTITDADGDNITFAQDAGNEAADNDLTFTTNGSAIALDEGVTAVATGAITLTSTTSDAVKLYSSNGTSVASSAASGSPTSATVAASTNRVSTMSIATVSGANSAIGIIDTALNSINSERATLGATQNRLDSVVSNLMNISENASAAKSRIMDADFAQETAQLARTQILQQAGISVLAQANAQPQNVLALLQ
jgi:flagellin